MSEIKYTCCDHDMLFIHGSKEYDVRILVFWCHQCGRVIKSNIASGGTFMNDVFTPIDNYKGCNRECL